MKKSLKDYANEMYLNRSNPAGLSEIFIMLGARYSGEAEERSYLRIKRAEYWRDHKTDTQGKNKSDEKLEMEWLLTEEGKKYDQIKTDMDAIDKMMKALTSVSIQITREIKNEA